LLSYDSVNHLKLVEAFQPRLYITSLNTESRWQRLQHIPHNVSNHFNISLTSTINSLLEPEYAAAYHESVYLTECPSCY